MDCAGYSLSGEGCSGAGSIVGVGSVLVVGAALEVVLVVLLVELADVVTLVDSGAGVDSGAPHAVSSSAAAAIGSRRFIMRFCFHVGFAKF